MLGIFRMGTWEIVLGKSEFSEGLDNLSLNNNAMNG